MNSIYGHIKKNMSANGGQAFFVAVLCVSGVLLFNPLSVIVHNSFEFSATFRASIVHYLASTILYSAALFGVLWLLLLNGKFKSRIIALFFSIGLLFWVQSNFIAWDYGLLDGRSISWNSFYIREIVDAVIWISVMIIVQRYRAYIVKNAIGLSVFIMTAQSLVLGVAYLGGPLANASDVDVKSAVIYEVDHEKRFVFSKDKNVIILVLDAYGDFVFQEVLKKFPRIANSNFDGFIRFNNMLGVGGLTQFSVPAYFTGKPYLNRIPVKEYAMNALAGDGSLLKNLRKEGWNAGVHKKNILYNKHLTPELLTEIKVANRKTFIQEDYDLKIIGLYVSVPQTLKRVIYHFFNLSNFWDNAQQDNVTKKGAYKRVAKLKPYPENSSDLTFVNDMLYDSIVSYDRPAFKYYHLRGVHGPYVIDRYFQKPKHRKDQNIFEVGIASLRVATRFLEILKEMGVYNSSQIYIMADHSAYPISSDESVVKGYLTSTYPAQAAALFLFKDFDSTGSLKTSAVPLTYFDLPEIVLGLAKKERAIEASRYIERFAKKKRLFYSFSNVASSSYYPLIIEAQVEGVITDPASWSMTGNSYMPAIVEDKVSQLGWGDGFSLEQMSEFYHYIDSGLMSGGKYTRGGTVKFTLPLKEGLVGKDVIVTLTLAPVLGEDVVARAFRIKTNNKATKTIYLDIDQYRDFSFMFPAAHTDDGNIQFSMQINGSAGSFLASDGRTLYSPGLKLRKLLITSALPEEKDNLIGLDVSLSVNSEG